MKLQHIFDSLIAGEAAQIEWADSNNGSVIDPANYHKIIPHINLGLVDLCTRFVIKETDVAIQLYPHISNYVLDSKYSWLNQGNPEIQYKYIRDSASTSFNNDLIKITRVTNEIGDELPLNEEAKDGSLYTPEYNVIQHPYPEAENAILIVYRAKLPEIPLTGIDPKTYEIALPETHLNALLMFIGQRLTVGMQSDVVHGVSVQYGQKYERAVQTLERADMTIDSHYEDTKLNDNGWV